MGFGLRISGFRFRVLGFGLRVSGLKFRVSVFGFRISVFEFRVGPGFHQRRLLVRHAEVRAPIREVVQRVQERFYLHQIVCLNGCICSASRQILVSASANHRSAKCGLIQGSRIPQSSRFRVLHGRVRGFRTPIHLEVT